jgi:hypothetical protein
MKSKSIELNNLKKYQFLCLKNCKIGLFLINPFYSQHNKYEFLPIEL